MSAPLDLRGLLEALHEHRVRFVAIGGIAVVAHGYVRATEDLDIVPEPQGENLRRLSNALVALDAVLPTASGRAFDPARDGASLRQDRNLTLDTRLGGLDLVQRIPGVPGFAALDAAAVEADLLGVPVRICALTHLRAMKQARGRAQDRADLEALPDDPD